MSARRILVAYATSYGQTAKIARYMADLLMASGDAVTLVNIRHHPRDFRRGEFDGVIVGGSIIRGQHHRELVRFVRNHRAVLNGMPSAFFSVSGSAASPREGERAKAREMVIEFIASNGWHPSLTATVGGAMAYTKYNPLMRWFMKRVAKAAGGPTDTSRDHELTDWSQIDGFVHRFVESLPLPHETRELVAT